MTAVAINGRSEAPEADVAEFDALAHQRLLRYVEPIKASKHLVQMGSHATLDAVQRAARLWTDGASSGELCTVLPVDSERNVSEGVLAEIQAAKTAVHFALVGQYRKQDDARVRAELMVLAVEVAGVGKYVDFTTVNRSASFQADAIRKLEPLVPILDAEASAAVKERLVAALDRVERLEPVLANSRQIQAASLMRKGQEVIPLEVSGGYHLLAEAVDANAPGAAERLRTAVSTSELPDQLVTLTSTVRLALTNEAKYCDSLTALVDSLSRPGTEDQTVVRR